MWTLSGGSSAKTQLLRADRGNRDRVRVMSVGLPAVPGVEHPDPSGQLRRHVNHVLPVRREPQRQSPAGAVAALDRTCPLRPGHDVLAHRGVAGIVGGEPTGGEHLLMAIDDLDGHRQRVGIDPDDALAPAGTWSDCCCIVRMPVGR